MMLRPRLLDSLASIEAPAWNALHDGHNPFVSHAFLHGLEQHGCLRADWGWTPRHLTLWNGPELIAAAPGYLKNNSHGEFVFDHAWARAYAQSGLDYFPKWLFAVPYSPVTGPRLLARDSPTRRMLLHAMVEHANADALSSIHVNFHSHENDAAFDDTWLARTDVQYHWRNETGWADFDGFLSALDHKHRKNIRQERAKVQRAGVSFRVVHGDEASDDDVMTMHAFYLTTFHEYGNSPALTLGFFHHLTQALGRQIVMFFADYRGEPVAGALCLRGGETLFGRYWGARANLSGLHFETCYYQGIEYCLREGLKAFEPGAQGEHKLARGFLPEFVRSRHWIAHAAFRDALRGWCGEEDQAVRRYARNLAAHSPFKRADAPPAG